MRGRDPEAGKRSVSRRIAGNLLALGGGATLQRALGIAWLPYLTRMLSLEEFGLYALVGATGLVAITALQWGSGAAAVRAMARDAQSRDRVIDALLVWRSTAGALLCAAALLLPRISPHPLALLLALSAPGLAGEMLRTVFDAAQVARDEPRPSVTLGVIVQLVTLVAGVIALEAGFGLDGVIAARSVVGFVTGVLVLTLLLRRREKRRLFQPAHLAKIAGESAPFGALGVITTLEGRIDLLMLATLSGRIGGISVPVELALGIFGLPIRIVQILLVPLTPLRTAMVPSIARIIERDPRRVAELYRGATRVLIGLILTPACLILIPAAPLLIALAGPSEFQSGAPVLVLLVVAAALVVTQAPATAVASAARRPWALVGPAFVALGCNIALNAILIPHWSYVGAAVATLIASAGGLLLRLHLAEVATGHDLRAAWSEIARPSLLAWSAVSIAVLAGLWIALHPLAGALAALVVYGSALHFGAILTPEDRARAAALLRGLRNH